MKAIWFGLILMCSMVFANITPENNTTILYGGETLNQTYTIQNDFSHDINTQIDFNFWNNSGNYDGIKASIDHNFLQISAYSKKEVTVKIETLPNVKPELYNYTLSATYTLEGEVKQVILHTYSGGGTTILDRNVIITEPTYIDKIVEVPKEVIKEIEKIVTQDKNVYVNSITNDSNNQAANPTQGNLIVTITFILIGILLGGLAVFFIGKKFGGI